MTYNLFKNGELVNTIVADEAFCAHLVVIAECDSFVLQEEPAQPAPKRVVTQIVFLKRFAPQERVAIRTAASSGDVVAQDFIHMLDLSVDGVDLDDPDTVAGVQYAESKAYIAAGRAAQILS